MTIKFFFSTLCTIPENNSPLRFRNSFGVAIAIESPANALNTLSQLIALQETTVAQARLLRDGEQRKFEAGESTLFLVNARERAVIDEELKRIALQAKLVAASAELAVALGRAIG